MKQAGGVVLNNFAKQIPARVLEMREILDISIQEMAERLGVTPEQYVGYENGSEDIPISILYEIAGIFKVDFNVLLMGEEARMRTASVVRAGQGKAVERFSGYSYISLANNFIGRVMEPLLVELSPNDEMPKPVMHTGQEFNMVLSGCVVVGVGKVEHVLNAGDAIYFDPMLPHYQFAKDGNAKFLTVICQ